MKPKTYTFDLVSKIVYNKKSNFLFNRCNTHGKTNENLTNTTLNSEQLRINTICHALKTNFENKKKIIF